MLCGLYDGVHGLRLRQPHEIGRRQRRHVCGRACADPHTIVHEHLTIDEHALDPRERKGRHRARSEAGHAPNPLGARDLRAATTRCPCDLAGIGPPVTRDEDDDCSAVAVENERLDDLLELAAHRTGGVFCGRRPSVELLDSGLDAGLPQKRGDPLDGVWPSGFLHGLKGSCATECGADPLL